MITDLLSDVVWDQEFGIWIMGDQLSDTTINCGLDQ